MGDDARDQPFPQPAPARSFEDEDIAQPGEGGVVGDDAGEADLLPFTIHAEAQRVCDGSAHERERAALRPVRAEAEVVMDEGMFSFDLSVLRVKASW
jgi:hypothetical protein